MQQEQLARTEQRSIVVFFIRLKLQHDDAKLQGYIIGSEGGEIRKYREGV